ncbi:MAG: hypothetical protein UF420_05700, partial [Ellagibacter isourolithinifaciens]|uniref:hypothetical protein n=1 Tax=Ellagibacter isourolithinifaciens TaxID=2137581 RepID=UPI002E7A7A26
LDLPHNGAFQVDFVAQPSIQLATGTHWMPPQVDVGSILATRSWIRVSVLEPQGPRKRKT